MTKEHAEGIKTLESLGFTTVSVKGGSFSSAVAMLCFPDHVCDDQCRIEDRDPSECLRITEECRSDVKKMIKVLPDAFKLDGNTLIAAEVEHWAPVRGHRLANYVDIWWAVDSDGPGTFELHIFDTRDNVLRPMDMQMLVRKDCRK